MNIENLRTPLLSVKPSSEVIPGTGSYCEEDLTLVYNVAPNFRTKGLVYPLRQAIESQFRIQVSDDLVVTADTLTIIFDGADNSFKGLDAYTNRAEWKRSAGKEPESLEKGILVIEPDSLRNGRADIDVNLSYEYSEDGWVRICLRHEAEGHPYQIGSDCVVTLNNGLLCDIYILNVFP